MSEQLEQMEFRVPERKDDALHWVHRSETVALCGIDRMPRSGRIRATDSTLVNDICPLCDALYRLLPA